MEASIDHLRSLQPMPYGATSMTMWMQWCSASMLLMASMSAWDAFCDCWSCSFFVVGSVCWNKAFSVIDLLHCRFLQKALEAGQTHRARTPCSCRVHSCSLKPSCESKWWVKPCEVNIVKCRRGKKWTALHATALMKELMLCHNQYCSLWFAEPFMWIKWMNETLSSAGGWQWRDGEISVRWKKGVVPKLCSRVHIAACVFCLFTAFLWFLWFLFCLGSCGHCFLCSGLSEACRDALYSAMLVIKNHATEGCWWSKVCIPACVLKLFFHTVTGKACLTLHYCLRSVVIHSSSDCASASGLIVTFM